METKTWIDPNNFLWKCEDKQKFSETAYDWIKYQRHIFKNSIETPDNRQLFIDIEGSKGFYDKENHKFWYLVD